MRCAEKPCAVRTGFQLDSGPDRPLQRLPPPEAQDPGLPRRPTSDHYRTRLTHTLEVSPDRAHHRPGPAASTRT
ncbi:MAG: hypothetical protein MZV70_06950 [Desulfobacterales bacterium]|nr:hypothetical protein [Desulfobacterales bacterium]